jgi:outer membrane protein assembly factor BamD (BamD/ComL family)
MKHPNGCLLAAATLGAVLSLAGCATIQESPKDLESKKKPDQFERAQNLFTQGNYEAALNENQRVLADEEGGHDVALFNMGVISAYSLNPKKDYPRALTSFKTLVNQHPQSPLTKQAEVWIQVLEEHQKIANEKQKLAEERQKLVEEKRSLTREKEAFSRDREALSQEREKLKYTVEKSRQLDMEIEKRRRQAQSR